MKSGVGVASMRVMRPELVVKSIFPVEHFKHCCVILLRDSMCDRQKVFVLNISSEDGGVDLTDSVRLAVAEGRSSDCFDTCCHLSQVVS
ncbi:hypothetical protein KY290_002884 [Solanum tuberosum]|uniref:Uncharacterized protein n=1 Tax=Solanum tuberosum TaxID=4113 RepID=A0ABQ7WSN4_SOLTU|nr:hypothetical protein KY290_002884 [Solanum tuberosum]